MSLGEGMPGGKGHSQKASFSTELEHFAQGITLVSGKAGFGCLRGNCSNLGESFDMVVQGRAGLRE